MAKSKSFFGLRRGSTKSHTFQVVHGQQITKDRVYEVTNPQTRAQMVQRLVFAAAALFYKHAMKNYFRFAYEDKKQTESDYNAFMRHNVRLAGAVSRKMIDFDYPAVGKWLLSDGRLGTYEPVVTNDVDGAYMSIGVPITLPAGVTAPTLGHISAALKAANSQLLDGDIITCLLISGTSITPLGQYNTAVDKQSLVMVDDNNTQPVWTIVQETINSESTEASEIFELSPNEEGDKVLAVKVPAGINIGQDNNENLFACAIVISRPLADGKVYVSRSLIGGNFITEDAIVLGRADDWKEWVADNYVSFSASSYQDAILKGSLLKKN